MRIGTPKEMKNMWKFENQETTNVLILTVYYNGFLGCSSD
jgi:hypothetical protein